MSRVRLITRANSGFGRAITEAAVSGGDVVAATARRVTALDDIAAAHPGQVETLALEVADTASIEQRGEHHRPSRTDRRAGE